MGAGQMDLVARLQVLGMMVDQSGLSKIESGQRAVADIEVIALARALKVATAWLLEGDREVVSGKEIGNKELLI